ncbi:unnamed protein product, partial [marine sediment metagenome]
LSSPLVGEGKGEGEFKMSSESWHKSLTIIRFNKI